MQAKRRLFFPVCDWQTPNPTLETISRKGEAKFRPLAKLISGHTTNRSLGFVASH